MKEENKNFLKTGTFSAQVDKALKCRKMSKDELYRILTDKIGYQITKTNYRTSFDKTPNINYLIALSKALNVSIEYLIGIDEDIMLDSDFLSDKSTRKFKKYDGNYYFYFLPTVSNDHSEINIAKLSIRDGMVNMSIGTDHGDKTYLGKMHLSQTYNIGYINLVGQKFGELISLSFFDPIINDPNTQVAFLIGGMLSISSGDLKRFPVFSRFILSRKEISNIKNTAIRANLLLNTKYIVIEHDKLVEEIAKLKLKEKNQEIIERITNAFFKRQCYIIEESFIVNTIQRDYALSFNETMELLDVLRLSSITDANSKINKVLDSRLYTHIYLDDTN